MDDQLSRRRASSARARRLHAVIIQFQDVAQVCPRVGVIVDHEHMEGSSCRHLQSPRLYFGGALRIRLLLSQSVQRGQKLRDVKRLIADGIGTLFKKLLHALVRFGPMAGDDDGAGLRIRLPH